MSIKRTIITTIVALALVAVVAPVVASATTVSDLMAQIAQLQAQLQSLSGSTTTTTTSGNGNVPAACVGVTFTRNLVVGSTGQDVKCLQVILNLSASTQVSATGAGAPGLETTYFGSRTLAAVKIWQAQAGFVPANQIGPMSRAKLNAWLGGTTSTTTTTTTTTGTLPAGCTSTSGYSPVTGALCSSGVQPAPSGPVSAALSSDNPAAGAVVASQASADLLHVAFSGSGVVTSVTLQRSGISDQNTLTNIYLYDGATRITDGYSFNLSGQTVINGLSIVVNGSKVISVRGDVAAVAVVGSSGTSPASTIAVAMTNFTSNSASSANIQGNTMSIVSGNLAGASLGTQTVVTASVNAGVTGYTFWSAPISITTRAVMLKAAMFKMVGSAPTDALSNIRMFVDGVDTGKVATTQMVNGSNYAIFDITSAPINLTTGSHTLDMRADVQKGTNRNITVSIAQAPDLMIFDPQVGVNIALGGIVPNGTAVISISTGSVVTVVDPTFTTQTNVSGGASSVVIGRFKMHAYGEDVKVQTLIVAPKITGAASTGTTCTVDAGGLVTTANGTCGLQNVTLFLNGTQVGSQQTWAPTTALLVPLTFTLGSQMILPAGVDSIVEVRADTLTQGTIAYTAGVVTVGLTYQASNGLGQSSQSATAVPAATVTTSGLTIQTGQLKVAATTGFLSQSISPNTSGVRIGSYTIQNQSTSEAIRLTSLSIATTTTTAVINNFSALRTSNTTGSGSTPIQLAGTTCTTPPCLTSTDTFSINDTLAIGASETVDIFVNTGGTTSGTIATTLNVSSIGVVDNIATTSGAKAGQTMTLGVGTVNATTGVSLVVSSTTPAQYIAAAGGATNATQATFNIVSTSGASTITELKFAVSGGDTLLSNTITQVCIGSVCAAPVSGIVDVTGLNIAVPNGGSGVTVNAQVSYSSVGTGGITPATTARIALTLVKYTTGSATKTLCSTVQATADSITCDGTFVGTNTDSSDEATYGIAAPFATLVGSKPTVTVATGGSSGLQLGQSNKIGEVTVAADAKGAIKVRRITFSVSGSGFSTTAGSTMSVSTSPFIAVGNTQVVGSSCSTTTATTTTATIVCDLNSSPSYATDYAISAGQQQTFNLFVTVTGVQNTNASYASVSSSITAAGFTWDDTSNNGGSTALGLTGTLIYGFPTNAYSIHQ